MPVRVRIKPTSKSLCQSCSNGNIVIFEHTPQPFVRCSMLEQPIGHRVVTECTMYIEKVKLSTREFAKIAYVIDTEALRKGKPGFLSPSMLKDKGLKLKMDTAGDVFLTEKDGFTEVEL